MLQLVTVAAAGAIELAMKALTEILQRLPRSAMIGGRRTLVRQAGGIRRAATTGGHPMCLATAIPAIEIAAATNETLLLVIIAIEIAAMMDTVSVDGVVVTTAVTAIVTTVVTVMARGGIATRGGTMLKRTSLLERSQRHQ